MYFFATGRVEEVSVGKVLTQAVEGVAKMLITPSKVCIWMGSTAWESGGGVFSQVDVCGIGVSLVFIGVCCTLIGSVPLLLFELDTSIMAVVKRFVPSRSNFMVS